MANMVPYLPSFPAYQMVNERFTDIIGKYGVNLVWRKSHNCSCVWGSSVPGSADPKCLSCHGRGIYWDKPGVAFQGLITFIHRAFSPDDPGSTMSNKSGVYQTGSPILSIPSTATQVFAEANLYDAYLESDVVERYTTNLIVGEITALPYQDNLSVATTGAVMVWNPDTKQSVYVDTYTVSGADVILNGYPDGTNYTVEFYSSPIYIAFHKSGGFSHQRPFSLGTTPYPRRFHLNELDMWSRSQRSGSSNTGPTG